MNNTLVIYWSGTGNTEIMAKAICEETGGELFNVSEVSTKKVIETEVIALGCSAMGSEELEESEFEPFMKEIESYLNKKRIALFGSYGWGQGEWMRTWEQRIKDAGAELVTRGLVINGTPDEEGIELCKALGKKLKAL